MSNAQVEAQKLIEEYKALVANSEQKIAALQEEVDAGAASPHAWFFIACIILMAWQAAMWTHMYLANVPVVSWMHAFNLLCWCYLIVQLIRSLRKGPRRLWRTRRSRHAQKELDLARRTYVAALCEYRTRLSQFQSAVYKDAVSISEQLHGKHSLN